MPLKSVKYNKRLICFSIKIEKKYYSIINGNIYKMQVIRGVEFRNKISMVKSIFNNFTVILNLSEIKIPFTGKYSHFSIFRSFLVYYCILFNV